jgi:hypothetical protein
MAIIANISNVRYLAGTGWDFGYDQQGREWVSVDAFTEDFEGFEVAECAVCGEDVEDGWFCKDIQLTVCAAHVEVNWDGYCEYTDEGDSLKGGDGT